MAKTYIAYVYDPTKYNPKIYGIYQYEMELISIIDLPKAGKTNRIFEALDEYFLSGNI